jgi:hypothetical protein
MTTTPEESGSSGHHEATLQRGEHPVRSGIKATAMTTMLGAGLAGAAQASEIFVTQDISVSETWTANNTYNLQDQIYVLPGATLTIEAGTLVASTTNLGGSLAVCKGAQIFVKGTQADPVIMTSKADVATWTGGNPQTGTWREAASEWGNLTVMGAAYISEDAIAGNVPTPNPNNVGAMEGLVAGFPGDTKVLYGGGDDDDDSGSIHFLSLRYGGKVIGLNNELNGLSLGGIGRDTDIDHVDIMNNVDDGIEIWGGTVNIKYFNIWNVGDDCFDVDQGWRGKAQFGLLVQGYSVDAAQGSGVGDNCFETDGAENSDWQPVTTAVIYNVTAVGQPVDGDQGTAWRDNARVQYRNSIFMDLGEQLVKIDNVDGDGGQGYGFNGTLSWAQTWTTDFDQYSTVNAPPDPENYYKSQTSGKLAEIKDSVFFRNLFATAYDEATNRGVFDPANNNVLIPGFDDADSPIKVLTRGAPVSKGGKTMLPVIDINPRPANEALVSVAGAPGDGFFTPAYYRGGFAPGNSQTWITDWTAAYAFGFSDNAHNGFPGAPYCTSTTNSTGSAANISALGSNSASAGTLALTAQPVPNQSGIFFHAKNQVQIPFGNGYLCAASGTVRGSVIVASGNVANYVYDNSDTKHSLGTFANTTRNFQFWFRDPMGGGAVFNTSNAIEIFILP